MQMHYTCKSGYRVVCSAQVLANLKAGGFEHAAQSALAAYEKEMRDADRAVSQWKAAHSSDSLTWMSRPDVAQVK